MPKLLFWSVRTSLIWRICSFAVLENMIMSSKQTNTIYSIMVARITSIVL